MMGSTGWLAAAAIVATMLVSPPANAAATVSDFDIPGGGGGGGAVPVPNTTGGDLVTTDPVPQPTAFDWTVSGSGLVWFDSTVTSAPGGLGGVVIVRRSDGGLFQFAGVEYALNSIDPSIELFSLQVQGFLGGGVLTNAFLAPASLGPYAAFGAGTLAGVDVDELRFKLDGARLNFDDDGAPVRNELSMSIRNLALDTASVATVPEPEAWALLIAGFALSGAALRRRRPAFA